MLAEFASSSTGRAYARSCERYGVDPAGFLDDDVLALNLRAAFAITTMPADDPERSFGHADPGLYERMKAMNR